MKTMCVVPGQIRGGFDEILRGLCKIFDRVIVSTWKGSEALIPKGDFELLLNEPPANGGIRNRNYQRVATQAGVQCADCLGCDYLLKWRPDMLPTSFSAEEAMSWSRYQVPKGFPSRIVMAPFRNLSIMPDWFSSFPDMYAFGHIEMIKLLWCEGEFDFTKDFNLPDGFKNDTSFDLSHDGEIVYQGKNITELYTCHAEHYSYFRDALQKRIQREIKHREICKEFLYLASHEHWRILFWRDLGINNFRSFRQLVGVPWLTESMWRQDKLPEPVSLETFSAYCNMRAMTRLRNIIAQKRETFLQRRWYDAYCKRNNLTRKIMEPVITYRNIRSGFNSLLDLIRQ